MIQRSIFLLFLGMNLCFSHMGNSQSSTPNNVYLFYVLNTNDTALPKRSDLFAARFTSSFTESDYAKVLNLSAQRVWNKCAGGDSIRNIDFSYGQSSLFTPDRGIESAQFLSMNLLNEDATVFGVDWPGIDNSIPNFDRFRYVNGVVKSDNLTLKKDLHFVVSRDTFGTVSKKGKSSYKVVENYLEPSEMALSFVEKWSFDPMSGIFVKDVRRIGFLKLKKDPVTDEHIGYSPTMYFENPVGIYAAQTDLLLKKNVICEESVRWAECSVTMDTFYHYTPEEAISQLQFGYSNIPSFERIKFLSTLFYYAFHHPEQTFPVKNNSVDSLHPFKSALEISNLFFTWDSTNQYENPEHPGVWINAPLLSQVSIGDVYAIRFYEDWYYDPKEFTIKKKVNGIGFVLLKKTQSGLPYFSDAGIYVKMK